MISQKLVKSQHYSLILFTFWYHVTISQKNSVECVADKFLCSKNNSSIYEGKFRKSLRSYQEFFNDAGFTMSGSRRTILLIKSVVS